MMGPRRRLVDVGGRITLTPAAKSRRGQDDYRDGPRRDRSRDRDAGVWQPRGRGQAQERRRLRLEDWFLAVHLLLSWDDQKMIAAKQMEETLSRFLKDAWSKFRVSPRLSTEIFLRGLLRTLWDIDRLLRGVIEKEELSKFTRESPLVLSLLRVLVYEFMWLPSSTTRVAQQSAADLMERCGLQSKADRDWIMNAAALMRAAFDKHHENWEKKQHMREERKRAEAAAMGEDGDGEVMLSRPRGMAQPKRRVAAATANFGRPPPKEERAKRQRDAQAAKTTTSKGAETSAQGSPKKSPRKGAETEGPDLASPAKEGSAPSGTTPKTDAKNGEGAEEEVAVVDEEDDEDENEEDEEDDDEDMQDEAEAEEEDDVDEADEEEDEAEENGKPRPRVGVMAAAEEDDEEDDEDVDIGDAEEKADEDGGDQEKEDAEKENRDAEVGSASKSDGAPAPGGSSVVATGSDKAAGEEDTADVDADEDIAKEDDGEGGETGVDAEEGAEDGQERVDEEADRAAATATAMSDEEVAAVA